MQNNIDKSEAPINDTNTLYWNGDLCQYTGDVVNKAGGIFYEFIFIEGRHKGEKGYTQRKPK